MSSIVHYIKFGKMYENVYYAGTLYPTHSFLPPVLAVAQNLNMNFCWGPFLQMGTLDMMEQA